MEVTSEQLMNIIGNLTVEVTVLTKQRDALLARLRLNEADKLKVAPEEEEAPGG